MPIPMLPLLLPALLSFAAAGVAGDAIVTGAVFCDRCRDGQRNFFDYPLYGARVAVSCDGDSDGLAIYKEAMTNWLGVYCATFDGEPDLSTCSVELLSGTETCGEVAGQLGELHLQFGLFGVGMFTADDLLAMPPQAASSCAGFSGTLARGAGYSSAPLLRAPACSCRKWAAPAYRCYWKKVRPGMKVAEAFGGAAGRRYGEELTLMEALRGRGDLYKTLLREATTALLNSHHSEMFFFSAIGVISQLDRALSAPPRQALQMALRFKRANSGVLGYNSTVCDFNHCI